MRTLIMLLVLTSCGAPEASGWETSPDEVIALIDLVNPADLTTDECLMRSAEVRAKVVAWTGAVHLWPHRAAADCGLPFGWSWDANHIESIYGGPGPQSRIVNGLLASPSHARHITGEGGFAASTRIGVANVGVWWVIHTAPPKPVGLLGG